ncbi:MAG: hypothetical protein HYV07_10635 [Deltaproteobacteria bacterium]|nr:hypothetical protein [Deltaproteobacteria bacterium]
MFLPRVFTAGTLATSACSSAQVWQLQFPELDRFAAVILAVSSEQRTQFHAYPRAGLPPVLELESEESSISELAIYASSSGLEAFHLEPGVVQPTVDGAPLPTFGASLFLAKLEGTFQGVETMPAGLQAFRVRWCDELDIAGEPVPGGSGFLTTVLETDDGFLVANGTPRVARVMSSVDEPVTAPFDVQVGASTTHNEAWIARENDLARVTLEGDQLIARTSTVIPIPILSIAAGPPLDEDRVVLAGWRQNEEGKLFDEAFELSDGHLALRAELSPDLPASSVRPLLLGVGPSEFLFASPRSSQTVRVRDGEVVRLAGRLGGVPSLLANGGAYGPLLGTNRSALYRLDGDEWVELVEPTIDSHLELDAAIELEGSLWLLRRNDSIEQLTPFGVCGPQPIFARVLGPRLFAREGRMHLFTTVSAITTEGHRPWHSQLRRK